MPTYEYGCRECGNIDEVVHSIKKSPEIKCSKCSENGKEVVMERLISQNYGGFIFKGGTASMAWKEKRLRNKKSANLDVKQIDRWGEGHRIQPNVAGHEVDSWSDASKLAKEAGMNTDSYKPMIEKEKRVSKSSGVDDTKWKAAKDNKDKS